MGDTSETNTKGLSRELFLGVVALKTPIPQNHYLRDKVPFPKSGHIGTGVFSATTPKNNSRDKTFVFVSELSPTLCLHSR